jgi:DNA polymerase elongation subunit (family B)
MLVDYEFVEGKLKVSYVDQYGKIQMKYYPWRVASNYEAAMPGEKDVDPVYTTWDKKPVKRVPVRTPNRHSIHYFMDELPEEEQKLLFDYHEPKIYFMDIETEVKGEFPEPRLAPNKVLNIAISCDEKVLVMGLQPLSEKQIEQMRDDTNNYFAAFNKNFTIKYVCYDSEYAMLDALFYKIMPIMPVLTGWNFVEFDWVYLVNRARNMGIDVTKVSPTGKLIKAWSKDERNPKHAELPAHRVVVDYMELYSKWDTSVKIKESSSLDYVAEQVLGVKKITYDGTLQQLHDNDYYKYTFYNVVDTILVQLIHEKRKYFDILLGIATLCRVRMLDSYSTIRTTEGVLRKKYKDERNIVFCKQIQSEIPDDIMIGSDEVKADDDTSLKGGWVKIPITGMNRWVCVFDFASLYPTTMRQNNIAPESLVGTYDPIKNMAITTSNEWVDMEDDYVVLMNNAVFKNEESVTTNTLGEIYSGRKFFKKKMMAKNDEISKIKNRIQELESLLAN